MDRVDSEIVSESESEIVRAPVSMSISMCASAIVAQASRDGRTSRAFEFGVGMMATSTGDMNQAGSSRRAGQMGLKPA